MSGVISRLACGNFAHWLSRVMPMHSPSLVSCRLLAEEYRSSMPTAAEANKWLAKRLSMRKANYIPWFR